MPTLYKSKDKDLGVVSSQWVVHNTKHEHRECEACYQRERQTKIALHSMRRLAKILSTNASWMTFSYVHALVHIKNIQFYWEHGFCLK